MTETQTYERKDEELVHELFKVFPRVFSKREPRDEYFANLVTKNEIAVIDIIQAPVVQAVTSNPEIIKRAIMRFRGFTVMEDVVKQCTYQKADSQNTLIIKDLPQGLQQEQVVALFHNETTAGPRAVSAHPDQYNTWFVKFASEDDAKAALALGKSLTFEGKLVRVTVKRDTHVRHGYDPRVPIHRPEYAGVDMMQMGGMPPMMNPYHMYYAPVMANRAYYPSYPAGMPYPPMNPPMMYPMDVSMSFPGYYVPQGYYPPAGQQPASQPGMGFQGRRPGRGGYSNQGSYGGRGHNGPRKEKSPRPFEQQAPAAAELAQVEETYIGDVLATTEEKPLITATTSLTESDLAVAEEGTTTMEEAAVAVEALEIKEEVAVKEQGEPEKKAPHQRSEGERQSKNFSGDRERRPTERKAAQGSSGPRNGKSRDRPSSSTRGDSSDAKKDKPKAPVIKFTMDADFPILVDQKQSSSPTTQAAPIAFDYANAVKKAPVIPATPVTPPSEQVIPSKPTEEVPAPVAVAPVFEPAVVVEVAKLVAVVEEVQPAVVVESENKLSGPTGTTKKSFLDALKANQ